MSTRTLSKSRKSTTSNPHLSPMETVEKRYAIWQNVLAVAKRNNATISEISEVIGKDSGLQQEIIFLAKCAKNYNGKKITSVEQAIMLVGIERICNAVEKRRKLELIA